MSMYPYPPFAENSPPLPPYVTYGLGMSPLQFRALQAKTGATRWIWVSLSVLFLIMAFNAIGLSATYVGMTEGAMISLLMLIASGLWLLGTLIMRRRAQGRTEALWRVYEVETAGGLTTTIYADRVVQESARWREEILLANAEFTEKKDLLVLEGDHRRICWRAADITPEQAWVIITRLRAAIPPERQFASGVLMPERQQPCPPPFGNRPPVCYDRFSYQPAPPRGGYGLSPAMVLLLPAASMVTAAIFTVLFAITGEFVLDYLIFLLLFFAGSEAVSVLIGRKQERTLLKEVSADGEITLSFTGEGLLLEQNGHQRFVAARDVHATRTENGALLHLPIGNLAFPWSAAHNRQQLEWMLFS